MNKPASWLRRGVYLALACMCAPIPGIGCLLFAFTFSDGFAEDLPGGFTGGSATRELLLLRWGACAVGIVLALAGIALIVHVRRIDKREGDLTARDCFKMYLFAVGVSLSAWVLLFAVLTACGR